MGELKRALEDRLAAEGGAKSVLGIFGIMQDPIRRPNHFDVIGWGAGVGGNARYCGWDCELVVSHSIGDLPHGGVDLTLHQAPHNGGGWFSCVFVLV